MPLVPFIPLIAAAVPMVTQGITSKREEAPPPVPLPTAMPTLSGKADSAARRKSLSEQIARKSRASSLLSATTEDSSTAFG